MTLHLFEGYGIEIESMIVAEDDLRILPIADRLLEAAAGSIVSDFETGELAWSNELVLHLIELKCNGPSAALETLPDLFERDVRRIEGLLAPLGARLLGSAMHPLMDPHAETRLWPHDSREIYQAYDRIFSCQGHGWSNLQSMHINLPFAGDQEFGQLHAAIRLVLPILPAIAASSPVVDGRLTGRLDSRLEAYRTNAAKIPEIAGAVIPEPVFSEAAYERDIYAPMMAAIAPHDPDRLLEKEFLNSRGAIARFDRDAIEIRVIDVQECPRSDLAVAALATRAIRALVDQRWSTTVVQQRWAKEPLAELFRRAIVTADDTAIDDREYLALFGFPATATTAGELWRFLARELFRDGYGPFDAALQAILDQGPLARRILRALGPEPDRARVVAVYRRIADSMRSGVPFAG